MDASCAAVRSLQITHTYTEACMKYVHYLSAR